MLNHSNSARNLSSLAAQPPSEYCHRFQDEDYFKITELSRHAGLDNSEYVMLSFYHSHERFGRSGH